MVIINVPVPRDVFDFILRSILKGFSHVVYEFRSLIYGHKQCIRIYSEWKEQNIVLMYLLPAFFLFGSMENQLTLNYCELIFAFRTLGNGSLNSHVRFRHWLTVRWTYTVLPAVAVLNESHFKYYLGWWVLHFLINADVLFPISADVRHM